MAFETRWTFFKALQVESAYSAFKTTPDRLTPLMGQKTQISTKGCIYIYIHSISQHKYERNPIHTHRHTFYTPIQSTINFHTDLNMM